MRVGTTKDNLKEIKCPSALTWGKIMVSDEDAGRVKQNAMMYVNKVADKRQISLQWNATSGDETAEILQAFDHEYIFVEYEDAKSNSLEVREFYPGDMSAPVYHYWKDGTRYQNVAFQIIER